MSEAFLASLTGDDWPRLQAAHCERTVAVLEVVPHAGLTWFRGHFDGHPVLPGIVQVHWAMHWGFGLFGIEGNFDGIDNLKFQRIIPPETPLTVTLEHLVESRRLLFTYADCDGRCSAGRIRLEP